MYKCLLILTLVILECVGNIDEISYLTRVNE